MMVFPETVMCHKVKSKDVGGGEMASDLGRVSVYIYVLAMGALFVYQTWISVNKYLDRDIVEEVSMTRNLTAVMPPLTFCALPGYTRAMSILELQTFSAFCPNTTDFVGCINDMRFNVNDLVPFMHRFPGGTVPVKPPPEVWRPTSLNLATGSCFTFQVEALEEYAQTWSDMLLFDMENKNLAKGWSFFVMIHNPDAFIPSAGISEDYMGQIMLGWTPKIGTALQLIIGVTHRTMLDTEEKPCEPDPAYNPVQCMENYITTKTGCKSPWDVHLNDSVSKCETLEDFEKLFKAHWQVSNMGALQYEIRSGCKPPCKFMDFDVDIRHYDNPITTNYTRSMKHSSLNVSLRSTNQKVSKEILYYQLYNLIGEIGGCLGMFLGVSLVSLYQMSLGAVVRAVRYMKMTK